MPWLNDTSEELIVQTYRFMQQAANASKKPSAITYGFQLGVCMGKSRLLNDLGDFYSYTGNNQSMDTFPQAILKYPLQKKWLERVFRQCDVYKLDFSRVGFDSNNRIATNVFSDLKREVSKILTSQAVRDKSISASRIRDWEITFASRNNLGNLMQDYLDVIQAVKSRPCVLLIDEIDTPYINYLVQNDEENRRQYASIIRNFIAQDFRKDLKFEQVFITGTHARILQKLGVGSMNTELFIGTHQVLLERTCISIDDAMKITSETDPKKVEETYAVNASNHNIPIARLLSSNEPFLISLLAQLHYKMKTHEILEKMPAKYRQNQFDAVRYNIHDSEEDLVDFFIEIHLLTRKEIPDGFYEIDFDSKWSKENCTRLVKNWRKNLRNKAITQLTDTCILEYLVKGDFENFAELLSEGFRRQYDPESSASKKFGNTPDSLKPRKPEDHYQDILYGMYATHKKFLEVVDVQSKPRNAFGKIPDYEIRPKESFPNYIIMDLKILPKKDASAFITGSLSMIKALMKVVVKTKWPLITQNYGVVEENKISKCVKFITVMVIVLNGPYVVMGYHSIEVKETFNETYQALRSLPDELPESQIISCSLLAFNEETADERIRQA